MTALSANITDSQTLIPVDAGLTNGTFQYPLYYTVDSESIRIIGRAHESTWLVDRGIAGTTAATHLSAATLTRYYPDGATGPGGGAIAVTDGTTTVAAATSIEVTGGTVTDEGGGVAAVTLSHRILSIPFAFNTPGLDAGLVVASLAIGEALLDALLFTTIEWDDGSLQVEVDGYTVVSGTLSGFAPGVLAFQSAHMSLSGLPEFTGVINDTPNPPAFATAAGDVTVQVSGGPPTIGASTLILVIAISS